MKFKFIKFISLLSILCAPKAVFSINTFEFRKPIIDTLVEYSPAIFDYTIDAKSVNITNTTVMMAYVLKSSVVPEGWVFSLCDSQKCNYPGTSSGLGRSLLPVTTAQQHFKAMIVTTTLTGQLELEYETYDVANPSVKTLVRFRFSNLPTNSVRTGRSILTLDGQGNNQSVSLTCNSTWSISGVPSWLSLNSITGSGNATLKFTLLEANPNAARTAVITISGTSSKAMVTITQKSNASTAFSKAEASSVPIIISPNPVLQGENLNINMVYDVELYDILGNIVFKQSKTNFISTSVLPKGLYFLKVDKMVIKKIYVN